MMRNLGKIVAHIPARAGSQRVRIKNLRYLAGKPLISYTITAARGSKYLSDIYVNTDSPTIGQFAEEMGVKYYKRSSDLTADNSTSDDFNYDIINSLKPDTLIMINPVCPLIEATDINEVVEAYQNSTADAVITSTATSMQCFYKGKSINIDTEAQLQPTQFNEPVFVCNWAISIWDANLFAENYKTRGYAVFGKKLILYNIGPEKSIKISTEEDFGLAEQLMMLREINQNKAKNIRYWGA